jgi:ESCRT-II complex subunit VPS25
MGDAAIAKWVAFPPFYTLQPNKDSQAKQLSLWKDYVLGWHKTNKQSTLVISEWPLFENDKINRKLSLADRQAVVDHIVRGGNGEWEDPTAKLRCTIFSTTIDDWAAKIYKWVSDKGMLDDPYTLYEIRCGEDQELADFYEMDEITFNRAIALLAEDGRARTFDSGGERGVMFYELA